MTQLFHPKWLLIIPAFLTSIFIVLSLIFSIFKLKFKEELAIISSTTIATILSIINLCVVCLAPAFTIFVSLMFLAYLIPDFVRGNEPHGYFSPENENIHIHADLKVFDGDKEINLYTEENMEKNKFFHFHNGKDQENVIHFEGKKGTLADFLETIDTTHLDDCIQRQYEKKESLYHFYINGEPSETDFGEYVVNDLDKLLLKCGG